MCVVLEAVDLSSSHRCRVTRVLPLSRPPQPSVKLPSLKAFVTPQLSLGSDRPALKLSAPSVTPLLSLGSDQPSLKTLPSPVTPQLSLKLDQSSLKPSTPTMTPHLSSDEPTLKISVPSLIPRLSLGLDEPSPKPSASSVTPLLSLGSGQPTLKMTASSVIPRLSLGLDQPTLKPSTPSVTPHSSLASDEAALKTSASSVTPHLSLESDCETGSSDSPLHAVGEQPMLKPVPLPSVVDQVTQKPGVASDAPQLSLDQVDKVDQKVAGSTPSTAIPEAMDVAQKIGSEMPVKLSTENTSLSVPMTLPVIMSVSVADQPSAARPRDVPRIHIPDNLCTRWTSPEKKLFAEMRSSIVDDSSGGKGGECPRPRDNPSVEIGRDPAPTRDDLSTKQTALQAEMDRKRWTADVLEKLSASSRSHRAVVRDSLVTGRSSPPDSLSADVKSVATLLPLRSLSEPSPKLTVTLGEQTNAADKIDETSASDSSTGEYRHV